VPAGSGAGKENCGRADSQGNAVGVEVDKDYCALSVKRIEKEILEKGQSREGNVIAEKKCKMTKSKKS